MKSNVSVPEDIEDHRSQHNYKPMDDEGKGKEHPRLVTWKGVVMYGICVILSAHFSDWTLMLNAGFWETFIGIIIVCSASGCMMFCIAEMTAALPFSGGTYGVVRVTLGDFIGYLVGTGEILLYIYIVAFKVSALGGLVTNMTGYDNKYEPLYWAIIYFSIIIVIMNQKLLFWRSVWVFGIYICMILLLYCTMTRTGDVDFAKYTKDPMVDSKSGNDRVYRFFEQLPAANAFFNLYLKVSPLACRECKNPTTDVPLAMYIVYALAIVSAFSILFCMSSIAPGVAVLRRSPGAPMSFGISSMFDIAMEDAMAFTFLAKYATCIVLTFAFKREMAALSKSGFLWDSQKWGCIPDRADRLVGLLVGCCAGYLLNIMILHWHVDVRLYVINSAKIFNSTINIVVFVTYIVFRQKFSSLAKKFRSPLGVAGAVYGLLVYIMLWTCTGALNNMGDHWHPFVLLACFLVLLSLPFVLYYRHHLTFSEEESSVLFVAYVIKANQARRLRRQKSGGGARINRLSSRSTSTSFQSSRDVCSMRVRTTSNSSGIEHELVLTGREDGEEEENDDNDYDEGYSEQQSVEDEKESEGEGHDLEEGGLQDGSIILEMQALTERIDPVYPSSTIADAVVGVVASEHQQVPLRSSLKDTNPATTAARSKRKNSIPSVRFVGTKCRRDSYDVSTLSEQPQQQQNDEQQQLRRKARKVGNQTQIISAVEVLTKELGYDQEVLSQINTEFDDYLNTTDTQSSSSEEEEGGVSKRWSFTHPQSSAGEEKGGGE